MEAYQQRVVDEKAELDAKLVKLAAFIVSDKFNDVETNEKLRLIRQRNVMQEYSDILTERIDNFPVAATD